MGAASSAVVRPLMWLVALGVLDAAFVAGLVAFLDTQRICLLVFDQSCDGPHWGAAAAAFGLALVLLASAVVVIRRLRRTAPDGVGAVSKTEG